MNLQRSATPLFVFEMANNHMGDVEHGLRIIREVHRVSRGYPFEFGVKLQFRDLDTYIHPDYRTRTDFKYVKRFQETRLEKGDFQRLRDEMKALHIAAVCTPFDERSVDRIEEMDFDVIKIASCSLTDWPLLERIVQTRKPIIASVAGSSLEEIDRVVSFLEHREKDFALLHCVGEYPTENVHLNLKQIQLLRDRHPRVRIGFSTHEDPENTDAIKIAVGCGASIFEKHVGVATPAYPLNAYSANPDQVKKWLDAAALAYEMSGTAGERAAFGAAELASLRSLRRGVFARRPIRTEERITPADVFFAIPVLDGHLTANDLSKYAEIHASEPIPANAPLLESNTRRRNTRERVGGIVRRVKEILAKSRVPIPPRVDLEISHHYGIERFDEFGSTMLTIVNRAYCKKMIILFPGQHHPEQLHRQKEETFHVLWGEVWITLDGQERRAGVGEVITVERGVKHSFRTEQGVLIEEISSTHCADDSFYTDPAIAENTSRKTVLTYWLD